MTNIENTTTSSENNFNKFSNELITPVFHLRNPNDNLNIDSNWNSDNKVDATSPVLTCKVEISPGIYLYGAACGHHVWIDSEKIDTTQIQNKYLSTQKMLLEVDPFFNFEALGNAYHNTICVQERKYPAYSAYPELLTYSNYAITYQSVDKIDSYGGTYDYASGRSIGGLPFNYLKGKLTFMKHSTEHTFKFRQPESGEIDIDKYDLQSHICHIDTNFFGLISSAVWNIKNDIYYSRAWKKLLQKVQTCTFKQGVDIFLIRFFEAHTTNDSRSIKGVEKRKDIKPLLDRLQKEEFLLWKFYLFLKNGRTLQKVNNNSLLAVMLLDCGKNYNKFKKQLQTVLQDSLLINPDSISKYSIDEVTRSLCMKFPIVIKTQAKLRAKNEWNMREGLSAQAQGLGIHPRRHKNLMRAITSKKIALSVFHTTGDPLNLINVEFDLWEKSLRRKGWSEVIYNICNAITNKNRFEKHITPYLSFLFRIEKYLKRHTGRNWNAFPKLVNSEAQLEMQERDENGTIKTRSALTPIVDNENNTITVPYAGLKMYGAQTTYCYSKHYFVFEKDTIDQVSDSVVVNELEKKLNGRDDYGLMYYTLDGSVEAQGYPTFLIIFERRSGKKLDENWTMQKPFTFVHFHRVHPSRKKDGRMVPACRLIEECYRYMTGGDFRCEDVYAQQGDLIFIKNDTKDLKSEECKGVLEFESHQFFSPEDPVMFWENTAKSIKNRLGFIKTNNGFTLKHPEHEWVLFEPGCYEIRRCRSYENNPAASWSYVCD